MKNCKVLLFALLGLFDVGCSQGSKKAAQRVGPEKSPAVVTTATPTPTVTQAESSSGLNGTPSTLVPIAALFDPSYDWNLADAFPATYLAQRFPIRLTASRPKSQVAFLDSPADFFSSKMTLLNSARSTVRLQTLIFKSDEVGYLIAAKLVELVRRGVNVRLIVDPVLNYDPADQSLFNAMRKLGVKVEGYEIGYLNYLNGIVSGASLTQTFSDANMRYHEKILVVDGEYADRSMAITGGTNFSNEYHNINQSNPIRFWYDRDVALRGPIAQDLANKFDQTFAEFAARRQSSITSGIDSIIQFVQSLAQGSDLRLPDSLDKEKLSRLRAQAQNPLNFIWQDADLRYLESRPRFKEDLIFPSLATAFAQAKTEILIHHAYLLPDPEISQRLVAAVQRGVKVRIITNHQDITDIPQLNILARSFYKDLLIANGPSGIGEMLKLYEWAGDGTLNNGVGLNHSKYVVIDRSSVLVGSYNLDPRSRYLNSEGLLILQNPAVAAKFAAEFDEHTAPKWTIPIDMVTAQKYALPADLKSQFDLAIARLLHRDL